MPTYIAKPTRFEAAGNKPKLIDEFVGRVNSATSQTSIAHCAAPADGGNPAKPRSSTSLRSYCAACCAWNIAPAPSMYTLNRP